LGGAPADCEGTKVSEGDDATTELALVASDPWRGLGGRLSVAAVLKLAAATPRTA